MGGTFDPIHYAHLVAAEEARAQLRLEKVLFVPAGLPPHKLEWVLSPIEHRLAMVALAIAGNPHFALSRVDADRPGPCYTTDTIVLLREEWSLSAEDIYLIMGSDSMSAILTWHEPARLIRLCRLAVLQRPGHKVNLASLEQALPGISSRLDCLSMPVLDISSSDLRRRVAQGRSIKYLVPEPVERYIYEHKLYRPADNER